MGRLRVRQGDFQVEIPALAQAVIGRHPTCTLPLGPPLLPDTSPGIPGFWAELRWWDSVGVWAWWAFQDGKPPALAGPGASALAPGWRRLRRGQVMGLPGEGLTIQLLDSRPPGPVLVRLRDWATLDGNQLSNQLEQHADGWRFHSSEMIRPLSEGQIFQADGAVWRFHHGYPALTTQRDAIDLRSPGCRLRLQAIPGAHRLDLAMSGRPPVIVTTERLRVLVPYWKARLDLEGEEGWLDPLTVAARANPPYRKGGTWNTRQVGMDRARLVQVIAGHGVDNAHFLFQSTRGVNARARIRPAAAQLEPPLSEAARQV